MGDTRHNKIDANLAFDGFCKKKKKNYLLLLHTAVSSHNIHGPVHVP